jgi:hypothetical protein
MDALFSYEFGKEVIVNGRLATIDHAAGGGGFTEQCANGMLVRIVNYPTESKTQFALVERIGVH